MTDEQIQDFFRKRGELEIMKIDGNRLLDLSSKLNSENNLSCDHRYSNGDMAAPPFQGSDLFFKCKICGYSVFYDKMQG